MDLYGENERDVSKFSWIFVPLGIPNVTLLDNSGQQKTIRVTGKLPLATCIDSNMGKIDSMVG